MVRIGHAVRVDEMRMESADLPRLSIHHRRELQTPHHPRIFQKLFSRAQAAVLLFSFF